MVVKQMGLHTNIHQIENKPLRERVLDILRDAIVSGEMKPGQALVESDLASQLGVSRAPLREAIQILNAEGLVEIIPYRGTFIRALTRRDVEELYSLRSVLESFAIQRIITRADDQAIQTLRRCFEEMLVAAQNGDLKQVNHIDRLFHDTLIEMSEHHLLSMTWGNVSLRVRQVMALRNRKNTDLTQIAYNHLPIIDAIAERNEERALKLIQQHVASSGDLLAETWDDET